MGANHSSRWIAVGVALLSLLLCMSLGLIWLQRVNTGSVTHSLQVENRLTTVLSNLQDAETGSRGYYLTGRNEFLDPYRKALSNLPAALDSLASLTEDEKYHRAAMARLRVLSTDKLAQIAASLALRNSVGVTNSAFVHQLIVGRLIMDAARQEIAGMRATEAALLVDRQARADTTLLWSSLVSLGGIVMVMGVTIVSLRENDRRIALMSSRRDELATANAALIAGAERSEAAESQVRQLHKMEAIGQLTGGIAHDFNNMLAIVIASLDLARRQLRTYPDKALARIDNALDGANRAATLTARLLAFSRQQALAPVALDPNRLIAAMSELLRRILGEHVQIETILGGGLWRVHADTAQLENTVINLCVNARDAMADGGRLTIETANAHLDESYARLNGDVTPGQYVMIAITDTGAGMSPETVQRAFEPFFTTKAVGKGTGLGLSQAFGFMKQSGGHVKIYSEPGSGTSVKLYIPRWVGPDETATVAIAQVPRPVATLNEVVLVVEDDPDVQRISVDALRYLGYAVLHASSAEEALKVMAMNPRIDLLFTDIVMPGVTGRVLAEQATLQRPDLKVLYTTGYARSAVVHSGVLDAGVAMLPKPFTVDQLASKVREVLDT